MPHDLGSAIAAPTLGGAIVTVEKRIAAGADDVEQRMSGAMWLNSTDPGADHRPN